ncbi:hypothetical protein HPB48_019851 [Haemaphysalis longicornis]|uniref:BTB domain-containing protein n=1 Tax=Haemaphysalis longicornis TaxID=44386 RepID=A0A9J6GMD9_HAELO|nr:hypothetical protein HPB48_019851 [Haemaphysalis longicornis]
MSRQHAVPATGTSSPASVSLTAHFESLAARTATLVQTATLTSANQPFQPSASPGPPVPFAFGSPSMTTFSLGASLRYSPVSPLAAIPVPVPVDKRKPQKPKPVPLPPPERYSACRNIRAHKQFLAMRNDVFCTMFFGSLPEGDKVLIRDLHPDGFYGFLKYLYTGTCKPDTFEEAMYTREAAEKYMAPEVVSACSTYIAEHISADKVCSLLDCLATSDLERVDKAALTVLKKDGLSVLNSKSFVDALESTVECVLKTVGWVPESCVVDGVFRWAEQRCHKSIDEGESGISLESVLRPFLPKLRFLALTAQEFVKGPAAWGVIEESEGYAILKNIVVRNSAPLPEWVCTEDRPRS